MPSPLHLILCRSSFPDRRDRKIEVGTERSLFQALREAHQPIASSCDGVAVCGRCVISVLEGADSLSEADAVERAVLRKENAGTGKRLACQSFVTGPGIVLSTDYW